MTHLFRYTAFMLMLYGLLSAQTYNTTLSIVDDYNQWGWDNVYVADNGLITTTIIPVVGARVLEYNLNDHVSMFVNPARLGFVSEDGNPYAYPGGGIGGYKVWPAPQEDWEGSQWPPPPILAWGPYTDQVLYSSADSVSLFFGSAQETSKAPGIRFERKYTFYKNSSRVKVEQIIINENEVSKNWSIWDNTQSIVNHDGQSDYENFRIYFPKNPDSHYGEDGYTFRSFDNPTSGWHGEVVPGIIGAHYEQTDIKLFADPHIGWICYVDEQQGYAYAKTFELYEDATYPDDQARVALYFNSSPQYVEVEVMGPVVDLAANGGRHSFTIDWWAAKVNGPILHVNHIGAIARHAVREDSTIKGVYGIFQAGKARLVFLSESGEILKNGPDYSVSPLETFNLSDTTAIPQGTTKIELQVINPDNELIGVLDSLTAIVGGIKGRLEPRAGQFELHQNYPNPFNPDTHIGYTIYQTDHVKLSIYNALGQLMKTLIDETKNRGAHISVWDGKNLQGKNVSNGIYFYTLESASFKQQRKMVLLR